MGAHVFLVSESNFHVCLNRGVYGCVLPTSKRNRAEIVAGVLSIMPDDLVFFYVKNKGIYGLWDVATPPYFDETKVWDHESQVFPYRFCFRPAVAHFPTPVSLRDVLDLRDKGLIWTFDLGSFQQKNQYNITTDEARQLTRLLLRNNPVRQKALAIPSPYVPTVRSAIEVELSSDRSGRVAYEGWLNAWFMQRFASGDLKDIFGDYTEFLNLVPTTFNKVMDIFLIHVAAIGPIEVPHKYTCVELKPDRATENDLAQVLRYEDWLARKLAAGDKEMIQTILVANSFAEEVTQYVTKRKRIEEKTVRLIAYQVAEEGGQVHLREEPPAEV